MFCSNCGSKIEEDSKFCHYCGTNIGVDLSITKKETKTISSKKPTPDEELLYYSNDWIRAKYFAVSSLPYLDILVTKKYFYLIQFPKTHGGTWGLVLGLLLFNILGAVIGTAIGNSGDRKNRQKYRMTWLESGKLVSINYNDYSFVKIPRDKLSAHLSFAKNKFILITEGDKIIKLKKTKKEFTQFYQFIKSYVL